MKYVIKANDYKINEYITLRNPLLSDVAEYDDLYWGVVATIVRRPYDDAVELYDNGIDYQSIPEMEYYVYNLYKLKIFPFEVYSKILGDINLDDFEFGTNTESGKIALINQNSGCIIDELLAMEIVNYVREIHFIDGKVEYNVGNNMAKKFLIDRMRRKQKRMENTPYENPLTNVISTLVNDGNFKYNYTTIWDLHVSQLYDAYYRNTHSDNYEHTMHGVYNGCVDHTKLNKAEISRFANIYQH